jgi:DNA-3-methyladenine glycosylase II
MNHYKKILSKDPKLKPFLKEAIVIPEKTQDVTLRLVWSIISQQLSITVAKIIYQRFLDLFPRKPSARLIQQVPAELLKSIGLSHQKVTYIQNVAEFMVARKLTTKKLEKMSDEEIIELLTQIKGVGRWTVEMLLIFGLGREDVFAVDDLGIQKAMIKLFKWQNLSKKELKQKMLDRSLRWSPYRTYVCLHFWRF